MTEQNMKHLKIFIATLHSTLYILSLFLDSAESTDISVSEKPNTIETSTNSPKFISFDYVYESTTEVPSFCLPQNEENATKVVMRKRRSDSSNASLPNSRKISYSSNASLPNSRKVSDSSNASLPDSQTSSHSVDISKLSDDFLECQIVVIEPECYIKFPNGSVRVPLYGKVFNDRNYLINEDGELFICPEFFDDFSDDSKFSNTLDIFSHVGASISAFCITLHIIMFFFLKNLRNLPGYCLFSLCKAMLLAYICYFTTAFGILHRSDCTAVGMIMLYAFLASFFWMNTMSYDVWRSLRMATAKLRLMRDRPMFARFALYCLYSWGGPFLIIITSLIVNHLNTDYRYNLIFNINTCWFHYKPALLVYFGAPFFILLFFNILLFIHSFFMITSATMNTSENKAALWSRFLVSMRLAIVMGLTWICGIIATTAKITAFWYIYTILNTLQGVFIFLCFSFTDKTIKECKRVVLKKKSSLFPSQTCTSRGLSSSVQQDTAI